MEVERKQDSSSISRKSLEKIPADNAFALQCDTPVVSSNSGLHKKNVPSSIGVTFLLIQLLEFWKSHLGMTLFLTAVAGGYSQQGRVYSLGFSSS